MEWDEAVIWALVMLPSVIPRGSSHDPSTEKNKQTSKNKNKTRKKENPKKPKINIFFLKGGKGRRRNTGNSKILVGKSDGSPHSV